MERRLVGDANRFGFAVTKVSAFQILSKFGYKDIDVCSDGLQAVEAARKTKYDLMLMDLQVR